MIGEQENGSYVLGDGREERGNGVIIGSARRLHQNVVALLRHGELIARRGDRNGIGGGRIHGKSSDMTGEINGRDIVLHSDNTLIDAANAGNIAKYRG